MRITSRTLRRSAPRALVAGLILAGAVAVTPASAAGGAFTGKYSGTYTASGNCLTSTCTVTLTGTGSGTYIGKSSVSGTLTGQACKPGSGTAKFTSTTTPANTVSMNINGSICIGVGGFKVNLTYTVTGGTGKFAKAAGSGKVTGTATVGTSGTFNATWKGTLTY